MAKAIITIDDEAVQAKGGFSIELSFDPPMPDDPNEMAKIAPVSAQVAMDILNLFKRYAEENYEQIANTEH